MDALVPGFGVRILGKPNAPVRSFILFKRFAGSKNPTRRSLGAYGELTFEQAPEKAREWIAMIGKGIDPSAEKKRVQQANIEAEKKKQANTFEAAFDAYFKRKAKLRTIGAVKTNLKRELAHWMDRPLQDISTNDVEDTIQAIVDRGHDGQAHVVFAQTKTFFGWVVDNSRKYGLETSPCERIKAATLIGKRAIADRVLADHEIRAYCRAASKLAYPVGPYFQLLMLTVVRRNEAADMTWGEIYFEAGEWRIPAARMKSNIAFIVPLTPDILEILQGLPRGIAGDYVFSNEGGLRALGGFSRIKAALDKAMKAELAKEGKEFEDFTIHDVRRSCRTQFSKLRITLRDSKGDEVKVPAISGEVAEALLAHSKPGLHKVYNLYDYLDEKRAALELWHQRLRSIAPKPDNVVVPMRRAG
jgi:integrase